MRHTHMLGLAFVGLMMWAARTSAVQQPAPGARTVVPQTVVPTFTTATNLVVLHVNVVDGQKRPVGQLSRDAFRVFEDGVEQSIEFFADGDVPLAAGLVIDNSTSMVNRQAMVRAGVTAFAEAAHEADEMFTVLFNEHVRMGLPDTVPFTRNRSLLVAPLSSRAPGGLTALHDAVIEALSHVTESANQKRLIVVLSDGEDNASRLSESNLLYRASQSSALIYTIWTGDVAGQRGNPGLLRRLAEGSGGTAYRPRSPADVIAAFAEVARTTRHGYSIGYTPSNAAADGTFRRVKVSVTLDGKMLTGRTRQGYTAPDEPGASGAVSTRAQERP